MYLGVTSDELCMCSMKSNDMHDIPLLHYHDLARAKRSQIRAYHRIWVRKAETWTWTFVCSENDCGKFKVTRWHRVFFGNQKSFFSLAWKLKIPRPQVTACWRVQKACINIFSGTFCHFAAKITRCGCVLAKVLINACIFCGHGQLIMLTPVFRC